MTPKVEVGKVNRLINPNSSLSTQYTCPKCPHRTKGTKKEVCHNFQESRCQYGFRCDRLHIHSKVPAKRAAEVLAAPSSKADATTVPSQQQLKENKEIVVPKDGENVSLASPQNIPSHAPNETTPPSETPAITPTPTSTPSQPPPPELLPQVTKAPDASPTFTCRHCPHPTRARSQEVCSPFQSGRCRMGGRCFKLHIHTKPPFSAPRFNKGSDAVGENAPVTDTPSICLDFLMGNCRRGDCKKFHPDEPSSGLSTPTVGSSTPTLTSTATKSTKHDGIKVVDPQSNGVYMVKLPNTSPTQLPLELISVETIDPSTVTSLPPPVKSTTYDNEDDHVLSDFSSSSSSSHYSTAQSQLDSSTDDDGLDDAHSACSEPELEVPLGSPTQPGLPPMTSIESDNPADPTDIRILLPPFVCKQHALHQTCPFRRFPSRCRYLHIDPSKVDVLRNRSLEIRKRLEGQPCISHLKGFCQFGDKCFRSHVNSGNATVLVPNLPCRRWLKGFCNRGKECDYDHEQVTFTARSYSTPSIRSGFNPRYHDKKHEDTLALHWAPNKNEGYIDSDTPPSTLQSDTHPSVLPAQQDKNINLPTLQGHNQTLSMGDNNTHLAPIAQPCLFNPKPLTTNLRYAPNLPPRMLAQLASQPNISPTIPASIRHDAQPLAPQAIVPPPSHPPGLPPIPVHKPAAPIPFVPTTPPALPLTQTYWTVDVDTHTKVRFSAGFNVESIMTGFESTCVVLENVPDTFTADRIQKLGERFGVVVNASCSGVSFLKFAEASAASKAAAGLHGTQLGDNTIVARLECQQSWLGFTTRSKDNLVRVDWDAPQRTAYAGFNKVEDAEAVIAIFNGAEIGGMVLAASLYDGIPAVRRYNIRLEHIPPSFHEGDLKRFLRKKKHPENQFPEEIVMGSPNYESLASAKQYVRGLLEQCGELLEFEQQSPIVSGNVRIWAHFSTSASAGNAAKFVHGRRPPSMHKTRIFAHQVYTIEYKLKPAVFNDAANDVDLLRKQAWLDGRRHASFHVSPPKVGEDGQISARRFIRISASDKQDLLKLKADFEMAIYGEVVRDDEGKIAWDNFFRYSGGIDFCMGLERQHPGVRVLIQSQRSRIRIFGPLDKRAIVRRAIVEKVANQRSCMTHNIPVSGQIIGIFIQMELPELLRVVGPENVTLQLWERNVLVRGNLEAYETVLAAVRRCEQEHNTVNVPPEMQCTVCFDQVTLPVYLLCGHRYCRTCLESYLMSSVDNKSFPLRCLGNEAKCPELIPLHIARIALDPSQFESLACAAFRAYIHARPQEFYHCPTPDCEQVYRHGPENTFIQCPSCTIRICPACHVEYHEGVRCEDYDEVGDKAFSAWAKAHGVKNCPGCKVPIEKIEGCNHMTCTRCQTHVCWVCMETFPKGEGIYAHMRVKHGGFGLEDPFQ